VYCPLLSLPRPKSSEALDSVAALSSPGTFGGAMFSYASGWTVKAWVA